MIVDAQATPLAAADVIAWVAKVTDKPIKYLLLTHYHAARTLGASAYKNAEILASDATRALILERGGHDMTKPDTPFPRHWLYYIVLKYGVLAAAVLIAFYVVYRLA